MKKILAIALLATGMVAGAQEKVERAEKAENLRHQLTTEERADLQVKRMTLNLDLTEKQQKEIKNLMLEEGKTREAKMEDFKGKREKGEKPSKEEMLKMKNDRLDKQIEMKKKMKTILDEKQYEKWENNQAKEKTLLETIIV